MDNSKTVLFIVKIVTTNVEPVLQIPQPVISALRIEKQHPIALAQMVSTISMVKLYVIVVLINVQLVKLHPLIAWNVLKADPQYQIVQFLHLLPNPLQFQTYQLDQLSWLHVMTNVELVSNHQLIALLVIPTEVESQAVPVLMVIMKTQQYVHLVHTNAKIVLHQPYVLNVLKMETVQV